MNDLISRQAALDAIIDEVEPFMIVEPGTTCIIGIGVKNGDVVRVLEQLPSAQPEIVRCKDCKHKDAEDGFCEGRGFPMQLVPDDGFCDKGEKRTDE